jgi:nucleotide-binding universal stress UspA family protein
MSQTTERQNIDRRASQRQSTDRRAADRRQPRPMLPAWTEPGRAVVVGVDGSPCNRAAVLWAAEEASATGRPLTLLLVLDDRALPGSPEDQSVPDQADDLVGWRLLNEVAREVSEQYPTAVVRKEMAVGADDCSLIARSEDQASLVVGRRGLGTFARLLVGSTSLSVTWHARVSVVVVPDGWSPEAHAGEAVVVGVDHQDIQAEVLRFAFMEARRRGARLVAAYGHESPRPRSEEALERAVAPYAREFPDVDVRLVHHSGHPLSVLLDEVGPSQLVVLGRHSARQRGAFPFGSVARGVLYYADTPVAIVPSRSQRLPL